MGNFTWDFKLLYVLVLCLLTHLRPHMEPSYGTVLRSDSDSEMEDSPNISHGTSRHSPQRSSSTKSRGLLLRSSHTGHDSHVLLDSDQESFSADESNDSEDERSRSRDDRRRHYWESKREAHKRLHSVEAEDDLSTESERFSDSPRNTVHGITPSHQQSYSPCLKKSLIMERTWMNGNGISSLQGLIDFVGAGSKEM